MLLFYFWFWISGYFFWKYRNSEEIDEGLYIFIFESENIWGKYRGDNGSKRVMFKS